MSASTSTWVNAEADRFGGDVDKVADGIAAAIKSEAADLAKAGYKVVPKSIRVSASPLGSGWLDITLKAER